MMNQLDTKYHVLYGESLGDVVTYLNTSRRQWMANDAVSNPPTPSWDLSTGWGGALKLAASGWEAGVARMLDSIAALSPPNAKESETRYDVAGYFPDVARFVAGDPNNMIRRGRTSHHAPVLNIVVSATSSAGTTAQQYANFGAAIASVVDKLESAGRRVELHVMFPNALRGIRCLAGWKVKAAEDHLDLAALCFSLAHPAAYRRLGFALWERTHQRHYSSGYGHCTAFTLEDAAHMHMEEPLLVDASFFKLTECATPAKAFKFVADQINTAAGEELVTKDN